MIENELVPLPHLAEDSRVLGGNLRVPLPLDRKGHHRKARERVEERRHRDHEKPYAPRDGGRLLVGGRPMFFLTPN